MITRLNLTNATDCTTPIPVPAGAAKLTIDINDASTFTWGSAVVDLQYTVALGQDPDTSEDVTNWQNMDPTVQLTSSTKARRNVGVTGAGWVRLYVSTPDGGADPNAIVTWRTSWNG